MKTVIHMTPAEYEELTAKQNEPSILLQNTIDNQRKRITKLVDELEATNNELSTYVLGGATPRVVKPTIPVPTELVLQYNLVAYMLDTTSIKLTVGDLAIYRDESQQSIKQVLKQAVAAGVIKRTNNKYTIL